MSNPTTPFPAWRQRALWPLLALAFPLVLAAQPSLAREGAEPADPAAVERTDRNLMSGLEAFEEGRYSTAIRSLRRVLRAAERDARVIEPARLARAIVAAARSEREQGNYDDALEVLQPWVEGWDGDAHHVPVIVECADLLVALGRFEAARQLVDALLTADRAIPQAHVLLAVMENEQGRADAAVTALEAALALETSHPQLFEGEGWLVSRRLQAIGEAWYYLDLIRRRPAMQQAIRAFSRARHADPANYDAAVWGGNLSLEAQQQADARVRWFKPVLDRNPNHIPARAGFARAYYFEWQSFRGREEALTAERIAPNHFETLLVMAEANISDQRYDLAVPYIERVLERNPRHLTALSVRALLHLYRGEREAFAALQRRVLELNPRYSGFYAIVAEGLMQQHRLAEALQMGARGLELDPRDWSIHTTMGMTHARMGNHEEANRFLTAANSNDAIRNSLYTLNMLQALRVVRELFREEATADGRFVIRTYGGESQWLTPLVERHLQAAWEAQSAKYGFEPDAPIVVEVFHRRDDFAARSVALPNLPALGVCFGQYITMLSPTALDPGSFSWARTLRHEMDHIFQIQASGGRVPRWLAEGCSVYEERLTRPEWTRQMEQQMIQFYHQDRLLRLATINAGFRSMGLVMFAYYQASYMVEFIVDELAGGDFSPIVRMLRLFGEDRTIVEVVDEVLGLSLEAFDEAFHDYVYRTFVEPTELAPYYGPSDLQRFRLAYEDNPEDVDLCAKLAAALLHNGSLTDARNFAGRALRLQRDHPEATLVWAHVLYQQALGGGGEAGLARARQAYMRCVELGVADFWVYLRLGQLTAQTGDAQRATAFYRQAKAAFPRYVGPGNSYVALAQLYQQQGNMAAARAELEAYCGIVETDIQNRMQLRQFYLARGNRETALRYLEEIVNVAPADVQLHLQLGAEYAALGRYDDAAFAYRVALGFRDATHEVTAATGLIEALRAAGRYEEALAEVQRRQVQEPEQPRWQRLRERVEASRDGRELPRHPDEPTPPERPEQPRPEQPLPEQPPQDPNEEF